MNKLINKIESKTGIENIVEKLSGNLSGSEFNSLLLEIFRERTETLNPPAVLKEFSKNRFVLPAIIDPITIKKEEIDWLETAQKYGFEPIELSPLTQLGTVSSMALVNQQNIVSALRGTEIVSDATNVMSLIAASKITDNKEINKPDYCTTHRHVRAQTFENPNFSAHFGLFCMISAAKDEGSFTFETEQLKRYFSFYLEVLSRKVERDKLWIKVFRDDSDKNFASRIEETATSFSEEKSIKVEFVPMMNNYYNKLQFKFYYDYNGMEIDLADGGYVDWMQKLLSDKKQRLIISAGAVEMTAKLNAGII